VGGHESFNLFSLKKQQAHEQIESIVHIHTIIKHIYCINLNICSAHSCNSNESSGTMKENS